MSKKTPKTKKKHKYPETIFCVSYSDGDPDTVGYPTIEEAIEDMGSSEMDERLVAEYHLVQVGKAKTSVNIEPL